MNRLYNAQFIKYGLSSVGALAVDMAVFMVLLAVGFAATPASGLGYAAGIVAHWLLSSRTVFTDSVAQRGPLRTRQKALFFVSALLGLAITTLVVGGASMAGWDPRPAKAVAIVASFLATWLARQKVVFR